MAPRISKIHCIRKYKSILSAPASKLPPEGSSGNYNRDTFGMRYFLCTFALWLVFVLALGVPACSRGDAASSPTVQKVVSAQTLASAFGGAVTGDSEYALVSKQGLQEYYKEFRSELFRKGVVKWDERFDCNHFAGYYIELAQIKFYLSNFHSSSKAQTLAIGTFWYLPDHARGQGHAIVAALTDQGVVFLDPQTGLFTVLTVTELQSAYVKLF